MDTCNNMSNLKSVLIFIKLNFYHFHVKSIGVSMVPIQRY